MYATTAMTIEQMRLRVALQLRSNSEASDGTVTTPTDAQDSQRLDLAIADGIRAFGDEHEWAFLRAPYTLTLDPQGSPRNIGGDVQTFVLPPGIESVRGNPTWSLDGQYGGTAQRVHTDVMRQQRDKYPLSRGAPRYVSVRQNIVEQDGAANFGTRPSLTIEIWPLPDRTYVMQLPVMSRPYLPFATNAPGNWPEVHDMTIVALAAREYARLDRGPDDQVRQALEVEAARRLNVSRERDMKIRDGSVGPPEFPYPPYGGRVTVRDSGASTVYDGPAAYGGL